MNFENNMYATEPEPENIWTNPDFDLVQSTKPSQKKNHWWVVKLPKQKGRYNAISWNSTST